MTLILSSFCQTGKSQEKHKIDCDKNADKNDNRMTKSMSLLFYSFTTAYTQNDKMTLNYETYRRKANLCNCYSEQRYDDTIMTN